MSQPRSTASPSPRIGAAAARVDTAEVALIGGYTQEERRYHNDVWRCLMIATQQAQLPPTIPIVWERVTCAGRPPPPCYGHTVTSIATAGTATTTTVTTATATRCKQLFVFGGQTSRTSCSGEAHLLDTLHWVWTPAAATGKPPQARCNHGAVAVAGCTVVIFGGFAFDAFGEPELLNDMHVYTGPQRAGAASGCATWSTVRLAPSPMSGPQPRNGHTLFMVGDSLLSVGGFDGRGNRELERVAGVDQRAACVLVAGWRGDCASGGGGGGAGGGAGAGAGCAAGGGSRLTSSTRYASAYAAAAAAAAAASASSRGRASSFASVGAASSPAAASPSQHVTAVLVPSPRTEAACVQLGQRIIVRWQW